jgi:ArsR family metal-binding transcriptional regulator
MEIGSIGKLLPCPSDPDRFRVIAHIDEKPDFALLYRLLGDREGFAVSYSEKMDMLVVGRGEWEMKLFSTGKVVVRNVDDVKKAKAILTEFLELTSGLLKDKNVD